MSTTQTETTEPSPWSKVAVAVGLLTVAVSVLLTAFAWPSVRSSLHDVPIAVSGPAPAVAQVTAALDQRMPDAFTVTRVDNTATAEELIRDREVYGAIDLSTGSPQVLTASAGSVQVAQALQSVATALGQAQAGAAPAVTVRDVVALPADDPRGAGLAAGALPLVMGGMLAAVLLTNLLRGASRRITGALVFAVTGGLALAAILEFWFGSLDGSYLANAGAIALSIAAVSLTLLGLESLFGYPGFGIGAVVMLLIGNPLSGSTAAPQMLPGWSGTLGQLLPPGAGNQLLRSTAFFDGQGATHSIVVLVSWLALGVVLSVLGAARSRRKAATAPQPEAVLAAA
ncbi:hypothetical protein KOI35_35295 [Actinoplanes bogorensis]|uniref:ABC transporter permease n=1 Tax=Paractinoplanes bogorensis TaxID=1610840 RepID=A0ABS5Z2Z2_9ACTN|nr:hypothetical protein [Actinoplanes bogorensis]MBU2668790.1 hypothetical protein [Actinoplanes bogorensis]